ncbi:MAG: hypothetical protein ACI39C_00230 [Dietzia sp.]
MHATEVADRVHRLAHAHVNCYLIDDEEGVTLVDAGRMGCIPGSMGTRSCSSTRTPRPSCRTASATTRCRCPV